MNRQGAKKNVLLFSPFCIPPNGPEPIVATKLVTAMSAANWRVDLITWSNSEFDYPAQEKEGWFRISGDLYSVCDSNRRNIKNIIKISKAALKTKHITSGLIWAEKSAEIAENLVRKNNYDVMISRSDPYWGHLPALMIKKKFNIPWIVSWTDPAPKQKYPPPYGKGPSASIPWFLKRYINAVSKAADSCVFCSERLMNYMGLYLPEIRNKSTVIPHICLDKLKMPAVDSSRFIVLHSGQVFGARKALVFIEGIKKFLLAQPEASIEIRWIGRTDPHVKKQILDYKLDKFCTFVGRVSYKEALKYQSQATILVVVEAACEEGIFLPSKFVDYVQSGRPILAVSPTKGTLQDILSNHGGGIAADVNSSDSVENALSILYKNWKSGTLNQKYSSARLQKLFCEDKVLTDYENIINQIQ